MKTSIGHILVLLFLTVQVTYAQTGSVNGTVKSTGQQSISHAFIRIESLGKQTQTDANGTFNLGEIPLGTYTLSVHANGYYDTKQEVSIFSATPVALTLLLTEKAQLIEEITILAAETNKYRNDSAFVVAKLPLKDLENPQVYNSIPENLLRDQVATEMNDALKNATGITRLWESTGRGGDGAEYYTMRGFSVQPTMINGLPSVNNGVVDPANVQSIEVIKGPSGTLFGSPMISYGGLINVTTKKPYEKLGGTFGFVTGNFGLNRITADINTPLNSHTSVRLNAAYTKQNSFQDAGFKEFFYVAPSFKFKATEKLTFLINTEFLQAEAANAPMIFLNRNVPISFNSLDLFERNYKRSFTSNDMRIRNPSFSIQAQALYTINKHWTSQTVVSRSNTKTAGYYHYLWDLGDGDSFLRYHSKRNGETQTGNIQQNFIGDFKIGNMRNRMVAGVDYFHSAILNSSSGWVGNGIVRLSDGSDSGVLTQVAVDSLLVGSSEGVSTATNQVLSAYVSDVINILPTLSIMASVRVDHFSGRTDYWTANKLEGQLAISPKFGVVYQPLKDRVSVFANYMNGFVNQAPQQVADADGSNVRMETFDPEQANQYEAGVKTSFWKERVALTGSYYHILVSNKLMSDPTNVNGLIQGGEVLSKGVELSLVANPLNGLNMVAGFSLNDTEVITDDPANGYLGLRPEESGPRQLINYWVNYTVPSGKLTGFGLGFGGNAASEHIALNRSATGSFTLPAYHILQAAISYRTNRFLLIAKTDNLLNTKFYSGWSGVIPQQMRSVSLSLNYHF